MDDTLEGLRRDIASFRQCRRQIADQIARLKERDDRFAALLTRAYIRESALMADTAHDDTPDLETIVNALGDQAAQQEDTDA